MLISHDTVAPVALSAATDIAGLLGDGYLAMALVDAVPAGIYGNAGTGILWSVGRPAVPSCAGRQCARRLGPCCRGRGAAWHHLRQRRCCRAARACGGHISENSHPPIIYPAALVAEGDADAGQRFLTYLGDVEARSVFEANGFTVLVGD